MTIKIKVGNSKPLAYAVRNLLLQFGRIDAPISNVADLAVKNYGDEAHLFDYGIGKQIAQGSVLTDSCGTDYVTIDAATEFGYLIELISKNKEVALNAEYTAVIDTGKQTVTVGCQTFPGAKIDELYRLLHG